MPNSYRKRWIDNGHVSQDDYADLKLVALSSMSTAEILMDECVERADRIEELESRLELVRGQRDRMAKIVAEDMVKLGNLRITIEQLNAERKPDNPGVELLDSILEIVNPLIKSGEYAHPAAKSRLLAIRMHGVCQTIVQHRRKHNIY